MPPSQTIITPQTPAQGPEAAGLRGCGVVEGAFSPYPALAPPADITLTQLPDHPCAYLPGRTARGRALYAARMPPGLYHRFMDAGFRRSGKVIYQPVCAGCRACQQMRVPVQRFIPSKSQRRCSRRNSDLLICAGDAVPSSEKYELYLRYISQWHGRDEEDSREGFESFLYDSPVDTVEFLYRDASGRLLGAGICDVCADSLSSVYFYFDPDHSHRGLGTFSALHEIETAARLKIPYYYMGYWISGCSSMEYKSSFRPHEILRSDGSWGAQ